MIVVGLPVRRVVVPHSAVASGAADHPRRHAAWCRCGLLLFQDPLLELLQHVVHLQHLDVEPGLLGPDIPGWVSFGEPGAMVAEPHADERPGLRFGVLLFTMLGCWVMRMAKKRLAQHQHPPADRRLGDRLDLVFDFVMEALFLHADGACSPIPAPSRRFRSMPAPTTSGRSTRALCGAVSRRRLCCLRYFTDDRGRTFVERVDSTERREAVSSRQQLTRFLAIFAGVQRVLLRLLQHSGDSCSPCTRTRGRRTIMKRSYFNGGHLR